MRRRQINLYALCLMILLSYVIVQYHIGKPAKAEAQTAQALHLAVVAPAQENEDGVAAGTAEALAAEYRVDVEFHTFSTVTEQKQMLRLLPDTGVDGVLLWPISGSDEDYEAELQPLWDANVPVVVVERDVGQDLRRSFVASGTSSALVVLEQEIKSLGSMDTLMVGNLSGSGSNQMAEFLRFSRTDSGMLDINTIADKKLRQLALTPPEGYYPVERISLEGKNAQSLNLKYGLINLFAAKDAPTLFFSFDNTLSEAAISAKKSVILEGQAKVRLVCYGTLTQCQDSLDSGVLEGLVTSRPEVSVSIGLRYLRDLCRGFWVPATMDSGIDFWTSSRM